MVNPYVSPATTAAATRSPVIDRISWIAVIPQLVGYGLMVAVISLVCQSADAVGYAVVVYLVYSWGVRLLIPRAYRRGLRLLRRQQFEQAASAFQESYDFFARNQWIDQYRAIVVLSESAMAYREIALCNMAFCYSQIGEEGKAEECYRRVLAEFPNNDAANAALRMIESGE